MELKLELAQDFVAPEKETVFEINNAIKDYFEIGEYAKQLTLQKQGIAKFIKKQVGSNEKFVYENDDYKLIVQDVERETKSYDNLEHDLDKAKNKITEMILAGDTDNLLMNLSDILDIKPEIKKSVSQTIRVSKLKGDK